MPTSCEQRSSELLPVAETQYRVSSKVIPLHTLDGYVGGEADVPVPVWAEEISAVYNPLTSRTIRLHTEEIVAVFTALRTDGMLSHSQLMLRTNLSAQAVQDAINVLSSHYCIVPKGKELHRDFPTMPNDDLEVYMSITNSCNMGCHDCATGIDMIDPALARTVDAEQISLRLRQLFSSAAERGVKKIKLKWAGGEPLLAKPGKVIGEMQAVLRELKEQYPEITLKQVVLTNGTRVTERTAQLLAEWGMSVSVSLWGVGEKNDQLRQIRNPRDNFAQIVQNIELLYRQGVSFNINHVITPGDIDSFAEMIEFLWDSESPIYIAKDWNSSYTVQEPIGMGIQFLRPQTAESLHEFITSGYKKMVGTTRKGFAKILDLVQRGIAIPALTKLDYLIPYEPRAATCGSGHSYVVLGNNSVTSCHERLPSTPPSNFVPSNLIDVSNAVFSPAERQLLLAENIQFSASLAPAMIAALQLHGGAGCPHSVMHQHGQLGRAGAISELLYQHILSEFLALEVARHDNSLLRA